MTVTYSPDAAPDLEPEVVRWQLPRNPQDRRELRLRLAFTAGGAAVVALALGGALLAVRALERRTSPRDRLQPLRRIGRRELRRLRRAF